MNIPLSDLLPDLPPVILRERVAELTGGLIAPKTLANHDSRGTGPARRVRIGKRVGYPAADLLAWLENHGGAEAA